MCNEKESCLHVLRGFSQDFRIGCPKIHIWSELDVQLTLPVIASSIDFIDNIAKLTVKCQICRLLCIRFSLHPLRCNCVISLNSTLLSVVRVQCAKACAHLYFVRVLNAKHVRKTGYREVGRHLHV